ncbi:twin-arginine translocase TatA/TatE family subunit [Nocardioides alkalitolerans]|uniref:twin-arginine translocase TatA/TatE family subunit n=1 Tax=Nocardioides alkalitolerans TaxID=281714 RepID=UPI0004047525|nr:twin-arginine translocase TatA/TatE family subunit [Nocardioides alkalitolerans]
MRTVSPAQIMIVLTVAFLLFGGRRLPDIARSTGQSLRIFRSEIKGLQDDREADRAAGATDAARDDRAA